MSVNLYKIHKNAKILGANEPVGMKYIGTLSLICCDWEIWQDCNGQYWTRGKCML